MKFRLLDVRSVKSVHSVVSVCCVISRRCMSLKPMTNLMKIENTGKTAKVMAKFGEGAARLRGTEENVWVQFAKLSIEHSAVNLGQGFPDFQPPDYVRKALVTAATDDNPLINQYARGYGHHRLVNVIGKLFSPLLGQEINVQKDILVTSGAYEALFCSFQAFVNPGDEVVIIEPYFDCYSHMTSVAGGISKFVPLKPATEDRSVRQSRMSSSDWRMDFDEFEAAFSERTKLLIFNNPNNPLGKVWSKEEMLAIAEICKKKDVIVISDEVYEWLTYGSSTHIRMATLPGMWDRTVTIGSAGKSFSVTGWKTGWTIGPANLLTHLQTVHQNCVYTCPTPIQEAIAIAMEKEVARFGQADCYFQSLAQELVPKRDEMVDILEEVGMVPTVPEGSYFMMADFSQLDFPFDKESSETRDVQFVKWLITEKKLSTIPPSAFYSQDHQHLAKDYIRFCFIKKDETLKKAYNILKTLKK